MTSVKEATQFEKDLASLLNNHSMENGSNTSDWILANYLVDCLRAFNGAIFSKENQKGSFLPPKDKLFVNENLKDNLWI